MKQKCKMKTIGITGRSGSGKSLVAAHYAACGYPVADGDVISREVAVKGSACLEELVEAFGGEILSKDGTLHRARLGELAFASAKNTQRLNDITHPHIMQAFLQRQKRAQSSDAKLFFLDGAAIIGGIFQKYCDRMIAVIAPDDEAAKRIMQRDGLPKDKALARLAAQIPEKTLIVSADYVLRNDKDKAALLRAADDVLRLCLATCEEDIN